MVVATVDVTARRLVYTLNCHHCWFFGPGCTRGLFRFLRSCGSMRCRGRHGQTHWPEVAELHSRLGAWGRQGPAVGILKNSWHRRRPTES